MRLKFCFCTSCHLTRPLSHTCSRNNTRNTFTDLECPSPPSVGPSIIADILWDMEESSSLQPSPWKHWAQQLKGSLTCLWLAVFFRAPATNCSAIPTNRWVEFHQLWWNMILLCSSAHLCENYPDFTVVKIFFTLDSLYQKRLDTQYFLPLPKDYQGHAWFLLRKIN